jgi:type I restriction enzyme S subunit
MARNWDEFTFSELIKGGALEIGDGYRAKLSELGGDGPIFLRAGHVTDTHIDFTGVDRFDRKLAESVRSKMSSPGDVVVTTKGNSTGRVTFVDEKMPPFVYSPHLSYWRSRDVTRIVPEFLRYWSRSTFFRDQLASLAASTDMAPYLSLIDQKRLRILLPTPEEQRAIAVVLGALDRKIDLNRTMNATLEIIVQTVFQEWFPSVVSFNDSVSGHSFGQIASVSRDSVNPLLSPSELFDHYSIPAYDERRLPTTDPGCEIKSNKFIVHPDSILLSKLNPRIPRIWLPSVTEFRTSVSSTEFLVLRPKQGWSREFVYGLCGSHTFQGVFSGMVTGTSGSHQRVKPEYLENLPVHPPPRDLVGRFTYFAKPIHAQVATNLKESATLERLRDALLPKLVSGEIGITQGPHTTEDVL